MCAFRILTSVADPGFVFCPRHWQSSNLLSRKPGRCVISNNVAYLVVFVGFYGTKLQTMAGENGLRDMLYAFFPLEGNALPASLGMARSGRRLG